MLLAQACSSTGMVYAMHQIKASSLVTHGQDTEFHRAFQRRVVAEQLLLEVVPHDEDKRPYGHSYEEILNRIRAQFEGAKTTVACLRWYAVHMRERGEKVPNRPRAAPTATAKKEA